MSSCRALVPFAALFVFVLLLTSAPTANPRTLVAAVQPISDGDTLIAITENQIKLRIGLLSTDAPEIPYGDKPGQAFGEEARDYLDT